MFRCAFCRKVLKEERYECGGCKTVSYCSARCQGKHWEEHKLDCRMHSRHNGTHIGEPIEVSRWSTVADEHSIKPSMTGATFNPADDPDALYVTMQNGEIYRVKDGSATVFADHRKLIHGIKSLGGARFFDERGLLTMKFHPTNYREYYMVYSRALHPGERQTLGKWFGEAMAPTGKPGLHEYDHVSVLAQVDATGQVSTLWKVAQPQMNHNGGGLIFDPENPDILYWGLGDGGGMNDMHGVIHNGKHVGFALDPEKPYGKLWRIDLTASNTWNRADKYEVPRSARMVAKGLRNPWRMAFHPDRPTELIVADVGQNMYESIKMIPLDQPASEPHNMGWKLREGFFPFAPELADHSFTATPYREPIVTYKRDGKETFATIGGFFDPSSGRYIFGDYSSLLFHTAWPPEGDEVRNPPVLTRALHGDKGVMLHSMAQDGNGQIYALMVDLENRRNKLYPVHPQTTPLKQEVTVAGSPSTVTLPTLREEDYDHIFDQAESAVRATISALRRGRDGGATNVVMQVVVMPRHNPKAWRFMWNVGASDGDTAWDGSKDIARAKAYTALAFSSNENAMTSRSVGAMSQDNSPLWGIADSNRDMGIITFAGGVPLYDKDGNLVGAVGVSGDGVDQDEAVAGVAAADYPAPMSIRIDTVTEGVIPYVKQVK